MEYPKEIYLDGYTYTQMYEHEKGGMYYHSEECSDVITGLFISLYPDGRLTYLWDGYEHKYGKYESSESYCDYSRWKRQMGKSQRDAARIWTYQRMCKS